MTTSTIDIDSKKQFAQPKLQTNQPPQQQVEIQQSWEWAKVRKIALRQMDKFMDLFPPVLRHEDLTAVNEMRVSCRRLEEILDIIYGKPRPRHIKKLRHRLQLCRRTLGELRNCDAVLAMADNAVATRRSDIEAWKALSEYLTPLRARTAVVTLEKLGRLNLATPYLRIKRDFDLSNEHRLNQGAARAKSQAETAIVYQRIVNSLASRWQDFAVAVERSHDDPCEHVIHRMRIAAKRLRYLTEVMGKLHIPGSKETLDWLKSLQATIGIWHDLEIMQRMLREIVAHCKSFKLEHLTAEHITRLIHHNSLIKKKSADMFFQMTRKTDHYLQVKHWVSEVLAAHTPKSNHH